MSCSTCVVLIRYSTYLNRQHHAASFTQLARRSRACSVAVRTESEEQLQHKINQHRLIAQQSTDDVHLQLIKYSTAALWKELRKSSWSIDSAALTSGKIRLCH